MRTTIQLDDQLLEMTKQYALTFTAIVEDALREKLMSRLTLNKQLPISLKTIGGNGVNAGIDLDDFASLLDVMERQDAFT